MSQKQTFNVFGAPQRPLESFTHTAPADDDFTSDPDLLSDQADWFETYMVGDEDYPDSCEYFYFFYRTVLIEAPGGYACNAQGQRWGVQMVAYECDADGRVKSWEQRVELSATDIKTARAKFHFQWRNDMLCPTPVIVPFEFEDAQIAR